MKKIGCLPEHQIIWRATLTYLTVHNAPKFCNGRCRGIVVGRGALLDVRQGCIVCRGTAHHRRGGTVRLKLDAERVVADVVHH